MSAVIFAGAGDRKSIPTSSPGRLSQVAQVPRATVGETPRRPVKNLSHEEGGFLDLTLSEYSKSK